MSLSFVGEKCIVKIEYHEDVLETLHLKKKVPVLFVE